MMRAMTSEASCGLAADSHVDDAFVRVREVFEYNLHSGKRPELGASLAVVIDGRLVVDLYGGYRDIARTRPWQRDDLCCTFSIGKAMASICLLTLYERGQLQFDDPICKYWPEFAAEGKEGITVRHLMTHQAGLVAVRQDLTLDALYQGRMPALLAAERPWWEPGAWHGYHVNTFGIIVAELVRRVTGMRLADFFTSQIGGPHGVEFHFQVPDEELPRVMEFDQEPLVLPSMSDGRYRALMRVYENPRGFSGHHGVVNTRAWQQAELPGTSTHSTARDVARLWSQLARGGGSLLSRETVDLAVVPQVEGTDLIFGVPSLFTLGFQRSQPNRRVGTNPNAFFHFGHGGSLAIADPDARAGISYVMNQTGSRWMNSRNIPLLAALYECL